MIEVAHISKFYNGKKVLDDVSLTLGKRETMCIIGSMGSGKSTLLRCMNFLEVPTYGEIWLDDDLLCSPDPYLHFDVIRLSNTYKKLFAEYKTLHDYFGTGVNRVMERLTEMKRGI